MTQINDLELFKNMVDSPNTDFTSKIIPKTPSKIMKVNKNIVITYPCDKGGCGFYRVIQPWQYINYIFKDNFEVIESNNEAFIFQEDILAKTRMIFFQRLFHPRMIPVIKRYKELQKKYEFKMVYEIDDYIWMNKDNPIESIPEYNPGSDNINDEHRRATKEIMEMCDLITVSSPFLGDYIKNTIGIKTPITFIPNSVAQYMWGTKRKEKITKKITKPKVIYTGSPLHYSNGLIQAGDKVYFDEKRRSLGDFENSWCEWILKAVKEDKIEFCIMGGCPWFLEDIKDKIKVIKWINSYVYHIPIVSYSPDFFIGPLKKNYFNCSKSDIKMIESFANGGAFIGTVFGDNKKFPSPYDKSFLTLSDTCSVEDIEKIIDYNCEPDNYNEVLKKQYDFMIKEGRYLESSKAIKMWGDIL